MTTISIVIPVKEEQETILTLIEAICEVFSAAAPEQVQLNEIIFVDDGSTDGTWAAIERAVETYPMVVGVSLRRNFGKAVAMQQGINLSTGEIIFTMDGDLQDDPKEIFRFLDALDQGADLVCGWKAVRHDPFAKTLPSKLFNRITALVSGLPLHDFNCGFKAYRRGVFEDLTLYGELYRFVPVIAHSLGYRVSEIAVTHHPRRFGNSKFGFKRLIKGFLDLLTIITLTRYSHRPGHLFGGAGIVIGGLGGLMLSYLTAYWFLGHPIGTRPLLIIGVLFAIVGVQFVLFGMVAELVVSRGREGIGGKKILAKVKRHGCVG